MTLEITDKDYPSEVYYELGEMGYHIVYVTHNSENKPVFNLIEEYEVGDKVGKKTMLLADASFEECLALYRQIQAAYW